MKRLMLSTSAPSKLRVLLLRGDYGWVAQCLEIDLAGQGRTIQEALRDLVQTFLGQAQVDVESGRVPFSDFKPAPTWYVEQYEAAAYGHLAEKLRLEPPEAEPVVRSLKAVRVEADVRVAA